jgi:hypothetical protein
MVRREAKNPPAMTVSGFEFELLSRGSCTFNNNDWLSFWCAKTDGVIEDLSSVQSIVVYCSYAVGFMLEGEYTASIYFTYDDCDEVKPTRGVEIRLFVAEDRRPVRSP